MAYNFLAEKHGEQDLRELRERLTDFKLIEFFPVEVSDQSLALGISVPLKVVDDPRFESELERAMHFLVNAGFQVIDLYSGNAITAGEISGLVRQISG